jgi:fibro-slime domain-containing protein
MPGYHKKRKSALMCKSGFFKRRWEMKKLFLMLMSVLFLSGISINADAGLLGTYYNHSSEHPDMERWVTGPDPGYVESTLSGAMPTLTTYGGTRVSQWDWWNPAYQVFQRVDSDTDLQNNFASSWFPVDTGLPNDPYDFAVHWEGIFYVDEDKDYTYSMGSDDDSWLFIDNELVLDLGGVHALTYANYTVTLNQGYHDIDIFFAERHVVQSGFQLNFFSDLEPDPIPEPATMLLLGTGLVGLAGICRKKFFKKK